MDNADDRLVKINRHINVITFISPILILCNILQKNFGREFFLNLSNILMIATLFQIIAFKLFIYSINKCNIGKHIDIDDTLNYSMKLIYINLLIGILMMGIGISNQIPMAIYFLIFINLINFSRQLLEIYCVDMCQNYHEKIVIVISSISYRTNKINETPTKSSKVKTD